MITSLLELHLKPEAVADSTRVLTEILSQTRAREGNEGVEVLVDVADQTHITVVEHWLTLEADTAYRAWRATDEGASGIGSLLASPPVLMVGTTSFTL